MQIRIFGAIALLLAVPAVGLAADDAHAPTVYGETGLFTLFTGQTVPQGEWSFGLYYNNWDRLVIPDGIAPGPQFSSEWDYDFNRLSASVGYGITDRFELSVMLPYDWLDAGDNNRFGRINNQVFVNDIDASGLGNVRLNGKWRLTGDRYSHSRLALLAYVDLNTGDDDEAVVSGETGYGVGFGWESGKWVANLGYHDPGDAENFDLPEEVIAGVGYVGSINDRLDWITEFVATVYTGGDEASDDAYDLSTGGRLWFGESDSWAFNFALRTNVEHLSDTDEFCPIGGLVGLTYFPRPRYTLMVEKAGDCDGTVISTSSPASSDQIDCGADCSGVFRRGTQVSLSATPADGCTFEGWSGDCAGGDVTMNGDMSCTATFEKIPPPPPPPEPEPEPEPEPPPPPPPPPVIEEVCQFAFESARVDNRCKATLDEIALRMKNESERLALVIGHTDSSGSESFNQKLSERRAAAVKAYLVNRHGIDGSRITTEGRGETDPAYDNSTREGREKNRRAVIILRVE